MSDKPPTYPVRMLRRAECSLCGQAFSATERLLGLEAELAKVTAERAMLHEALRDAAQTFRQTHINHCSEAWTSRGLHAPECCLADAEAIDTALSATAADVDRWRAEVEGRA